MIREYTDEELAGKIMRFIVCLHKKEMTAALHIMAFTYNADGPLRVVGLNDTIFMDHVQGCVESNCMVRKVLLDAWHLGVMMTLAVVCDETVEAVSRIVLLNEAQNHFFEGNKRQHK